MLYSNPEAFYSTWDYLKFDFALKATSLVLYGIYICLFLLSLYTLSRRGSVGTKLLIVGSCMMAILGSSQMALDLAILNVDARSVEYSVKLQKTDSEMDPSISIDQLRLKLQVAQDVVFALNNFITDAIFLNRCYVIWDCRKKIIVVPVLLMLSTLVVAVMAGVPSLNTSARTACILGFALNVVLTGLTAGRIVWIQRKSASTLSDDDVTRSRCTRATKIILESGLIYCVVALFIVMSFSINEEWLRIGFGLAAQLMNIVPTFTLVYVGLKNMAEEADSAMRTTGFHSTKLARSVRLLPAVAQLRRRSSVGVTLHITTDEVDRTS
ncbi:hypothetical protein R3P38DRAFT_929570 [Favolaschia claudopus]|uniref:Gustatory receptor n=1 Tax=Favolaschia claudopus TaxID=2862362 RepID=A0AAW0BP84_9AGAR